MVRRWMSLSAGTFLIIASALFLITTNCTDVSAKETIKFGCAICFTGKDSLTGKLYVDSYNLAKEKINKKGGIKVGEKRYPIEIIYYDDKSDDTESAKLVNKLITEDGIDFLLGPYSSEITLSAGAVAEKHRVPMVQGGGAVRNIFKRKNKYVFGTLPAADQYFTTTLEMMTTFHPKPKRIAVVFEEDLFHTQVAEGVKKTVEKIGLKIVLYEKISETAAEFSTIFTKIKSLSPDALLISCHTTCAINLIQQAKEQNVRLKMLSMTEAASEANLKESLGKYREYIFGVASWSPRTNFNGVIFKDTKGFIDLFKEKYGYDPDYHNASAVAVLSVFKNAIEAAGTLDRKKVRNAIAETDLETIYGVIKFNPDGRIKGSSLVLQVQGGEIYQVYPKGLKVPVYPMPDWKDR
ncbi:MAG: amino acid ABC transporter substrate-binding protein [Deltaproteobacteria bacterium]|nr:amino acid ABC transporter substrate-binding protein [Deltaproteobacteria bacterium]